MSSGGLGELWLIRHAETEWSAKGWHTGHTDVPLSDVGRAQAAALADRLGGRAFPGGTLASPLARARDTAALAGYGDALELRDDLKEVDYGAYEGLTTPVIRERDPGWVLWRDGCPDGESVETVGARVDRVIEEITDRLGAGDLAVFAHGHLLRILGARWLEQPASFGGRLTLRTTGIAVLGHDRETRAVVTWNR